MKNGKFDKQFILNYFKRQSKLNDDNCFWSKEEADYIISLINSDMKGDKIIPEKYVPILKGLLFEWLESYKENPWHKSVEKIHLLLGE